MIIAVNDLKTLAKHLSCESKFKFGGQKCYSHQWWYNDTCWFECKKHHMCEKDYSCEMENI